MENKTQQPKPKKNINTLRDILFEQLNAIRSAETSDELNLEKERGKAMLPIAETIMETAKLEMQYIDNIDFATSTFLPIKEVEKKQLPLSHNFDK